jgi:hypothetical protein
MNLFIFIGLQVLDALTTLLFLHNGVSEANPLVRAVLASSASPALALAPAKIFAVALAIFAWRTGRKRLLWKMNVVFVLCVAWNLVAAAVGHPA